MKVKFNKYERIAGLFVVSTILGIFLTAVSVAVRQGWFATKFYYTTNFENADGVRAGTPVQMAGLRAGEVDEVELQSDNRIRVRFYVLGKFQPRIKEDSKTQLIRPFIIGDRVLEVTVGSEGKQTLAANAEVQSHETVDVMTLMSGKSLGTHLEKLNMTMQNLSSLLDAFTDKDRTDAVIRMFDRLDPLLANVDTMASEMIKLSRQATYKGNLQAVVGNLAVTTHELNTILPELNRENPQLAKDLASMTQNLSSLVKDFKVLGPAVSAMGPELPQTTKRAVEALNEAVVLLKAMQKSMFMRGSVQEVREEEARQQRVPANQK